MFPKSGVSVKDAMCAGAHPDTDMLLPLDLWEKKMGKSADFHMTCSDKAIKSFVTDSGVKCLLTAS